MPPKKKSDPEFIGPHCCAIGLNVSSLGSSPNSSEPFIVTNGVIIEMNRYAKKNRIERSVFSRWLSPLGFDIDDDMLRCVDVLCSQRDHLRRGKKMAEVDTLERGVFSLDALSQHTPPVPSPSPQLQQQPVHPKRPDALKEDNTLSHVISQKHKQVTSLEDKVSDLRQEIVDRKKEAGHYGPLNVDRRDARHKQTRMERDSVKDQLALLTEQNLHLTKSVSVLEETVQDLRTKHHKKQKLLSYYKNADSKPDDPARCKFCSDSKKDLTNLTLEKEALEVELEDAKKGVSVVTKDSRGAFTHDIRMCVMELLALEVATAKVKDIIKVVSKHLFTLDIPDSDLPSRSTCQKIADEGHVIAKSYVAERMQDSKAWGLHKDGTSRRKVKILDTAVCLDSGEVLSLGFSTVASETGQAIADDSIMKLKEVKADTPEILEKMSYTMSDRAANEKKSNRIFNAWREEIISLCTDGPPRRKLQHFFCMAHVLLGFHNESVVQLKEVQTQLTEDGRLGRDCHPGFKAYRTNEAAPRLCVSASNAFAPVGDYMGVRDIWDAYCVKNALTSQIKNYKDNRFNGLFHTCAAVTHHRHHFLDILSKLKNPNKKLAALLKDLEDERLMTIVKGLGIMYLKVTAPFWTLVTSKLSYLEIQPAIVQLREELQLLVQTPTSLTADTALPSLDHYKPLTLLSAIVPFSEDINSSLEFVLKTLLNGFVILMDRQLGQYLTTTSTTEDIESTSFAPSTNLICERNFGDLDSSQHRRPAASFYHISSIHMLKRGRHKITSWVQSMSPERKDMLFKEARKQGPEMRKKHQANFKSELAKSLVKINPCVGKRKRVVEEEEESDDSDDDEVPPIDVTPGCWVAVAYPDGWYPGIVEGIVDDDDDMFDINFAYWCPNQTDLKWPDGKDRHPVHRHFIIQGSLHLETQNIRTWNICSDIRNIQKEFLKFKDKYF